MYLAIFLDDRGGDSDALAVRWQSTLAALPPDWLSSRDYISVYAADCNLVRSLNDGPYNREILLNSLSVALAAHDLHQPRSPGLPCSTRGRLWDNLAVLTTNLARQPGWRVILGLTDGVDGGSISTWKQLQLYAGPYSVSIFGLRPATQAQGVRPDVASSNRQRGLPTELEDQFGLLCAGTGGLALPVVPESLEPQLRHAVSLLRNRYILQFAPPSNGTGGLHDISVEVPDPTLSVNLSGISYPTPDKDVLSHPGTLQSDPSRAPLNGERRILTQPH